MRIIVVAVAAASSLLVPSPALAWGYEGHEIVATIARADLTPAVRAKVDAILGTDTDTLTAPDMASRATWADAWRSAGHRETAQWHFVDTEIDGSADIDAACFDHLAPDRPASAGPMQDCVVDKIREFTAELSASSTPPAERLLALKYLLHFVGDVHQPLHASDNHDRGGNCLLVSLGGARTVNLHSYWDTVVVENAVGKDVGTAATMLRGQITPADHRQWQDDNPAAWAREAFGVAKGVAYTIGSPAGCQRDAAAIALPDGYEGKTQAAAMLQLEKAGVRLGMVLNRTLANAAVTDAVGATLQVSTSSSSSTPQGQGRAPASLARSASAGAQGLHGKERQRFRRACMRNGVGSYSSRSTPPTP